MFLFLFLIVPVFVQFLFFSSCQPLVLSFFLSLSPFCSSWLSLFTASFLLFVPVPVLISLFLFFPTSIFVKGPGTYFIAKQRRCYAEFFARKFYFRLCVLFLPGSEVLRLLLVFKFFLKLFVFNNFQAKRFCFCISIMY